MSSWPRTVKVEGVQGIDDGGDETGVAILPKEIKRQTSVLLRHINERTNSRQRKSR